MTVHVQYRNKKYDYVQNRTLESLIRERSIRQFYRPSEKKWVNVDLDPVRGRGGKAYSGENRRKADSRNGIE